MATDTAPRIVQFNLSDWSGRTGQVEIAADGKSFVFPDRVGRKEQD